MTYKLTQGWPQHIESGSFVNPETNTEYLAWLAEGNTPLPADPPPIPSVVSMGQARAALIQVDLLATVEAALAVIPGKEGAIARSDWEYRTTVDRSWPLVQALKAQLNWTEAQLDDLFTLAATL